MDLKSFFWATKEKTLLTLGLFVLVNIFFFPSSIICKPGATCPPNVGFVVYTGVDDFLQLVFFIMNEIVYLGFSFLIACTIFHFKEKRKVK